jgi:hypothetical protein
MNYLQLCQRLRQEAMGAGATSSPGATTGQQGQNKQFVDWINAAWLEIQSLHQDWRWMRKEATVSTTAGDGSYEPADFTDVAAAAAISAFSHWHTNNRQLLWTLYSQSVGQVDESDLWFISFDEWRYLYDRGGNVSTQNRPFHYTAAPDNTLKLGYKPDGIYVVRGWYQKSATELSGDSDSPEMPSQYHLAIVWRALMYYGEDRAAPEKRAQGQNNFSTMLSQLEINQLPAYSLGGPMVS